MRGYKSTHHMFKKDGIHKNSVSKSTHHMHTYHQIDIILPAAHEVQLPLDLNIYLVLVLYLCCHH